MTGNLSTQEEKDTEETQRHIEEEMAATFKGRIVMVAAIRCGAEGCDRLMYVYPEHQYPPMTGKQARAHVQSKGWKQHRQDDDLIWFCPDCI